jgi:anti-sigma-K factor RskA
MAFRQNVGIALALAVGMALGYAVTSSAQMRAIPTVLRVEAVGLNRVRVTVSATTGATRNIIKVEEARGFDVNVLDNKALRVWPTHDPNAPLDPRHFSIAIPQ